jgi:phospholipid transport system transporter-binding protein
MGVATAEFRMPGVVRFANAGAVRAAGEQFLDDAPDAARISLAELEENNSVVVALLLAWVRHARGLGRTLCYTHVPGDLRNIIELYGVADILPLEDGSSADAWSVADDEPDAPSGQQENT